MCIHVHVDVCMYTEIHIPIHIYIYVYIYICIQIYRLGMVRPRAHYSQQPQVPCFRLLVSSCWILEKGFFLLSTDTSLMQNPMSTLHMGLRHPTLYHGACKGVDSGQMSKPRSMLNIGLLSLLLTVGVSKLILGLYIESKNGIASKAASRHGAV